MKELILPWPHPSLNPNKVTRWSADEDEALSRLIEQGKSHGEIAMISGRSIKAVKNRAWRIRKIKDRKWSDEETAILIAEYKPDVFVEIDKLAAKIGRTSDSIHIKASRIGLGDARRRKKSPEDIVKRRKYTTNDELRAALSKIAKERIERNGHPRGMAGKRHTKETKQRLAKTSLNAWLKKTPEEQQKVADNFARIVSKQKKNWSRKTWKSGWRLVGDREIYFRSRWEANYAMYLQWLLSKSLIKSWDYEPKTFWFENIKRGVRSYKPDFLVTENDGISRWHEVKGWMDSRSKTCLSRMKKYYPDERVVLIQEKEYKAIRRKVMGIVPGWEDSERDRRS